MNKENNKINNAVASSKNKAPNILKGMIPFVFILISSLLSLSWYIINYQVEELVAKRTSEYAHSIVKIAADSSAEALLAEDNLQLELLVQNIAKDRYIRVATIYSSDGVVVTKYPKEDSFPEESVATKNNNQITNEISSTKTNSLNSSANDTTSSEKEPSEKSNSSNQEDSTLIFDYLAAKKNIPFTEKIAYKGITAGWFKIEIDGYQLESDFRANFHNIRSRVFALITILLIGTLYILFRFRRKVEKLVKSVNLLVVRKAQESDVKIANTQSQWFEQVDSLAESSFSKPIRLREMRQQVRWKGEAVLEAVPAVWFAIDLPKDDIQGLAEKVVTIEKYVKYAANAYFTYSQGDVFSGSIVPFLQHSQNEPATCQNSYTDLVSFTFLMKELMNSMDANIKLKAVLFNSNLYKLHSDDSVQNKVIIPQRKKVQVNKLANLMGDTNICCLTEDANLINEITTNDIFLHKQKKVTGTYQLKSANHDIMNHVARISKNIIDSDIRH
ncbi:MAG: hypothetical protein ACPGJI_04705 [Kangiellaceae bacterium]